ncbi:MAG TPA: hypothetical protein VGZ22_13960, partial [Isosphaeraceae bacterium]|nr:hypothetical protein [Isosphaeraceae bacterium]
MPDCQTPPSRHRWKTTLSLRTLMVLVLFLGGGSGWFAYRVRVQRDAVRAITRANGHAYYDWQWNPEREEFLPNARSPVPGWLLNRLGEDAFSNVVAVQCSYWLRGPDLRELSNSIGNLNRLEILQLWGRVTDAHLIPLERLTRLRTLLLTNSDVTDA